MADTRAHAAVALAIREGRLAKPTQLKCVDCGQSADVYDHFRGYARGHWLDVEPVCFACNTKRAWQSREAGIEVEELSAVLVRMPTWLLTELDQDARASGRSRNSHVVWILQQRYSEASARHPERLIQVRGPRVREDSAPYCTALN